jgi:hypothetical protein
MAAAAGAAGRPLLHPPGRGLKNLQHKQFARLAAGQLDFRENRVQDGYRRSGKQPT